MSKHFEDGQYDDDLTVGIGDFDNDDLFEEVDLLKYKPFESPLAQLKSLVLSIDWEITDDILRQFNEELLSLREMWRGEKIYLVYIQALETISKYIYQEKSSAHPNAVKLLPAFYYNLEKIVLEENLTDTEKQDILLADVKRFNNLKKQLVEKSSGVGATRKTENVLHGLKSLVLGIDWEITEADLDELRKEVLSLERVYKESKPKLILLQGIGTLAAYIRHKGSNAHADVFTLLHDFYATLEEFSLSKMSLPEEKEKLFVEVEKFNAFKTIIATTISPEALSRDQAEHTSVQNDTHDSAISFQPAFADVEADSVSGFQEDQVAASLDSDDDITNRLESFFSDEAEMEAVEDDDMPATDTVEEQENVVYEAETRLDDIFKDDFLAEETEHLDKEIALQGVDVETEADDDSEEEALPVFGDEIAPALADNNEVSFFSEGRLGEITGDQDGSQLDTNIFEDEDGDLDVDVGEDASLSFIDESSDFGEALTDIDFESTVEVDSEELEPSGVGAGEEDASPLPALADFDQGAPAEGEDEPVFEDQLGIENTLDAFFEDFDGTVPEEDAAADSAGSDVSIVVPVASEQVDLLKEYFDEDTEDTMVAEGAESEGALEGGVVVDEESIDESIDQFFDFDHEEDNVVAALADVVEPEESSNDFVDQVDGDSDLLEVEAFFDSQASETPVTLDQQTTDGADLIDSEISSVVVDFESPEDKLVQDESEDVVDSEELFFGLATDEQFVEEQLVEDLDVGDDVELSTTVTDEEENLVVFLEVDENVPEDSVETVESFEETVADVIVELPPQSVESHIEVVDCFSNLRSSIQSLGIEIETQIVNGVFSDINQLRQRAAATNIEKSFLQLLSTVVQHIDHNRYLSSDAAYDLVLSIFAGLETTSTESVDKVGQVLLLETYKVLQWQQNLLNAAQASSILTGLEGGGDVDLEEESVDSSVLLEETLFSEGEDELIYAGLEEELAEEGGEGLTAAGVDDIRSELQSLRKTLQGEISQLRAELLDK